MAVDNLVFQYSDDSLSKDYFNNKAEYIFEDIKRIKQIINHVRTFSRDQAKETKELIDLETTIKDALSMVATQYQNHQVTIHTEYETGCYAYGNKYKLEQVLLNILSNSKHALDKKQQSTNSPDFKKNIDVILVKNLSHNIIKIKDNGTGISKKNLEMIFNPFFTTKNVNEGTGLGLSISFGIIKEMDGDIEVETKENEYTLMKIILPLADTQ
jgi:signal transduction histidine kinase